MTTWQEYFEHFIRPRLQNLAASQTSGRELIERLHAIATDYKLVLFNDSLALNPRQALPRCDFSH
jgi:hypothetical protein